MSCKKFLIFPNHDYTKWEITEERDLTQPDNRINGKYIIQERKCNKCGYTQKQISRIK